MLSALNSRRQSVDVARMFAAWLLAACLLGPAIGRADQTDPALDELFAELNEADSRFAIKEIESQIQSIWSDPDSDSIDLLMNRAQEAMDQDEYDVALIHLDDVVDLAPEFAEGWNRRATLFYLMKRYDHAVLDIEKTVMLEPRHFGAWSGLGLIFLDIGNKEGALKAYRKALAANPHLARIGRVIKELEPDVAGRAI